MVNPRIPLKLNGETIRRSKNMELEKEEVRFALKHGPVYRKFSAQVMERVTLQNIDELHVANKNETVKKEVIVETPVQEPVQTNTAEDTIESSVTPIINQETTEEVITPGVAPEVETIKPEVEIATEEPPTTVQQETVDGDTEETAEVESVEEESEEVEDETEEMDTDRQQSANPNFNPNNNYYRKKRKNRQ
jgi:hypothetical protein